MAKQGKIKFDMRGLTFHSDTVDQSYISQVLKGEFRLQGSKADVKIGINYATKRNIIQVKITVGFLHNEHKYLAYSVESDFYIEEMNSLVNVDKRGEKNFKDKNFVYFIVDQSLAHTRAIQFNQFNGVISNLPPIPYLEPEKVLIKKNELTKS